MRDLFVTESGVAVETIGDERRGPGLPTRRIGQTVSVDGQLACNPWPCRRTVTSGHE